MCTVQVLLFADVSRRPADLSHDRTGNALRPSAPRNICRRLFVDENEQPRPSALLKTLEADLERQVKERWNFDFRTGKPLPGRYQWVNARPDSELSTTAEVDAPQKTSDVPRKKATDGVPQKSATDGVPRKLSEKNGRTHKRTSSTTPRPHLKSRNVEAMTQSKITDFLQQRKRQSSDSAFSPKLKSRRLQVDLSATSH